MRLTRFHVPDAASGARVDLPDHAAHHAREVLRLRAGVTVRIFDGRGHEFEATIESVTRRSVTARLGGPVLARPESPLRLVLALSALKGDRMEWAVQKATELGVFAIWPMVTARTEAAARPALQGSRQERWEKVAAGAAEQSGRAFVPDIAPATTFDAILRSDFEGLRLMLDPAAAQTFMGLTNKPTSVLLIVGPAGGWEPDEVDRATNAGCTPVQLGPRVLRTETAALSATVGAQLLWGDLGVCGPHADD